MKYYLIGIKGSGMSALALILKDLNNEVKGADINSYLFTEKRLNKANIEIESLDNMDYSDSDIIVIGNTFINKYSFKNKEVVTYQQMLSYICDKYYSIAVCGTHGKTTITNMIKHVLEKTDNVSYLIGDGQGKASKESKYFVFEACEHQEHFLSYYPNIIVCDNIDYDHVEYYKNKTQYKNAFKKFFNRAKDLTITNSKIKVKNAFMYGYKKANIIALNTKYLKEGIYFDLLVDNRKYSNLFLPFHGRHMFNNALACISVCYKLNKDIFETIKLLQSYIPADRRYSKTIINSNVIIDDYGHHPNEIKETINAIKQEYKDKDLIIFYHPDRPKRLTAFVYKYQRVFNKSKITFVLPFINNGKEEENALLTIIDNKKIVRFDKSLLKEKYENTVFLFTGSKQMDSLINNISVLL